MIDFEMEMDVPDIKNHLLLYQKIKTVDVTHKYIATIFKQNWMWNMWGWSLKGTSIWRSKNVEGGWSKF